MHTSNRILIVGGGVAGLSIAVRLAQAGLPVTVLEAARLGEGASTRNQGWLYSGAWFALAQPDLARLCHESLYQTLDFCPECVEPQQDRMLLLISRPETLAAPWTRAWEATGIPYEELSPCEARERVPGLPPEELQHAFLLPDRAIRVDVLLERLAAAAQNAGAEIRTGTRVGRLLTIRDAVHGVATDLGEELTGRLVILAGNARGLWLLPGRGDTQAGRQPDYAFVPLKTHLLALEPGIGASPFCVLDAEGFNHIPHDAASVFGNNRWLPVADPADEHPVAEEVERIRRAVERFFPELDWSSRRATEWAGTTVQAMRADQVEPGRAPFPTVIDHEHEPPAMRNLLSVFPGRATLWAHLAEETRRMVLDKLRVRPAAVVPPPWTALEDRRAPLPDTLADLHNAVIYHCQVCGRIARREEVLAAPMCCERTMSRAAATTVRDA